MGIVKRSTGDTTHDGREGHIDVYEVTKKANPQGHAVAQVEFERPFQTDTPKLLVSTNTGTGGWRSRGAKQATLTAGDAEPNSEVVFTVIAIGTRKR